MNKQSKDALPLYRCLKCGRLGNVGRCCGNDTREPLNEAARTEMQTESLRLEISNLTAENAALHTRIAELEAALDVAAEEIDNYSGTCPEDTYEWKRQETREAVCAADEQAKECWQLYYLDKGKEN